MVGVSFHTLHAEGVLAELAADETSEQSVEVAPHWRRSVDDARLLVSVDGVRGIQADLGCAVQAFGRQQGKYQSRLDFLERNGGDEAVAVDFGTHSRLSEGSGRRVVTYY